ncbi:MAG TPA: tRNA pseudouridine(55) synthase TruB [Aggregatilineaceae bacterium]|nr:tRNA pseudouridine(55) synthase TruB [Aggregatilineaceae bacterium]
MGVFGLLNICKPKGPTSHDIVATVRRGTRVKKVGHAGTLDPMASGVLVLGLGPATRLSEYVMESQKTYRARVRLGIETDTYDAEGRIVAENPALVERARVEGVLATFRGEFQQVPPMYSAIKIEGRKLYEIARAGAEVERTPRPVTVYRLDLTAWEPPDVEIEVVCSPGTYIRSLAFDLGRAVGVGAHLVALERTASGLFTVENAVDWETFKLAMQDGTWQDYLLPPDMALYQAAEVRLSVVDTLRIRQGMTIHLAETPGEIARAYDSNGQLLAVLKRRGEDWKPEKVFLAE